MIAHLHLQDLKAWRDSGAVQLAPVTMLLGSNSSGKSTLLQSLLLLKQTVAAPDRTVHLNLGGDEAHDLVHLGGFDDVLARGVAAPRQFSIALAFQRPEGERVRHGRFSCRYGQTASGAVAIQALELSTVARRFRAVRRERGAYAVYVDDEPRPRGKGPQLAPERSIALPAEALALLGSDGHQAIDALLANALLPSEHQGSVLRSVSHWLQRMTDLADRKMVAAALAALDAGNATRITNAADTDWIDCQQTLQAVGLKVENLLPDWLQARWRQKHPPVRRAK